MTPLPPGTTLSGAGRVEARHLAVLVVFRALHLVTHAEVQGEVRPDLPVVLEVAGVDPVARQVAEQVRGDGVGGNRARHQLAEDRCRRCSGCWCRWR